MAYIKVIAKKTGYYEHGRKKEGQSFLMDEKDLKVGKEGKPVLPSWVDYAEEVAETKVVATKEVSKKSKDAVI